MAPRSDIHRSPSVLTRLPGVAIPLLTGVLSGCSLMELGQVRTETRAVERTVNELRDDAPSRYSRILTVDRPWVGLHPLQDREGHRLPRKYLEQDAVTLPLTGIKSAAMLAARLEAATGLQVRLSGSVRPTAAQKAIRQAFRQIVTDELISRSGIWTGRLDHLLDTWTSAAGYDWRYHADINQIEIIRSRTVIFQVHALTGEQRYNVSSSTRDSDSGNGSSNQTFQSISTRATYNPWPEIEKQVKGLVEPGTRVTIARSSASVTVSGPPRDIRRIRDFLAYLNRQVLRPVVLSVHVYSVRFQREIDYDLGLSFAISRLLGTSLNFGATDGTVALVKPESGEGVDSLQATIKALNRVGSASRVLSADIPSLNGKPAQFFELVREAYLKELRTTVTNGVTQTQMVPGTVSSGFAMSYLPRITSPGEVLVRLSASLQDRPVFRQFSSSAQSIQLPTYGSRAVQVTQRLGRGETLIVSGFGDQSSSSSRGGTLGPDLPLPEGERSANLDRVERIMLITAKIGAPLGVTEVEGSRL